MFHSRLGQVINLKHELVNAVPWSFLKAKRGANGCDGV